jgi:hypothetical protein
LCSGLLAYKNFLISGGGLPNWQASMKWRALGLVVPIAPGGQVFRIKTRTIVINQLNRSETIVGIPFMNISGYLRILGTVVLQRLEDDQAFQSPEESEMQALEVAKQWMDR